jgi:hypothetical protein
MAFSAACSRGLGLEFRKRAWGWPSRCDRGRRQHDGIRAGYPSLAAPSGAARSKWRHPGRGGDGVPAGPERRLVHVGQRGSGRPPSVATLGVTSADRFPALSGSLEITLLLLDVLLDAGGVCAAFIVNDFGELLAVRFAPVGTPRRDFAAALEAAAGLQLAAPPCWSISREGTCSRGASAAPTCASGRRTPCRRGRSTWARAWSPRACRPTPAWRRQPHPPGMRTISARRNPGSRSAAGSSPRWK